MSSTLSFLSSGVTSILKWQPFIDSRTWMEKELRLIKGKIQGSFSADRMPHTIEIFEDIDKQSVVTVTLMWASQTAKTTFGIGNIFKLSDTEKADALIMFPRESELKKMYDNKVKPLLDGCKALIDKIKLNEQEERKKTRSFGINLGGVILNILATNNTKSVSTKFNLFDEVVEFAVGKLEEAMERAKSFNGSGEKYIITSTQHPTKNGDDVINYFYNISEVKKQYWMCCIYCEEHFYPEPETLIFPSIAEWKKDIGLEEDYEPNKYELSATYSAWIIEKTRLRCPHCSQDMDNDQRKKQILDKKCKWFQVEPQTIDENGIVATWKKAIKPKTEYKSVGTDVNTLCIEGYNMGDIAQKIVQNEYSRSKIAQMQMLYVGYFNRIYRTNIKKRESAEILLLSNGLKGWIIPKDTAKLYFIVDTQKDHYWWMVMAVQWGRKYNVVAHGRADEDAQLEELMFRSNKTEDGGHKYIDRAYIDMRGYQREEKTDSDGEVIQSKINTTDRIREFIIQTNIKARTNGFIKRDEHILWGTMGREKIGISDKELGDATSRGESPVGNPYLIKTMENKENAELTYKVMFISNLAAKTELFVAINDNIDNFKNIVEGKEPISISNLFFINEDMRQDELGKPNPRDTDFSRMMTAEIYDYDIKNGKLKEYRTYIRLRKRNDQLDNAATAQAASMYDNIGIGLKPQNYTSSGMSMFKKAFKKK